MRLLVLGGGGFLGFHVAAEALAVGHAVTVFNREGEAPLPGVEALAGDREGDLSALDGREWDAVLDTFSDPAAVRASALRLSGRTGTYGYVSGMSVYHPDGPPVPDEDAPVRERSDPAGEDPLQERSLAKLACEAAVRDAFAGTVLVVRPGIMVGPRDPTDRFTWWPVRLARAARDAQPVLAPGDPSRPVQFTDARDLAAWIAAMLAGGGAGTYNGVGPGRTEPLGEVLAACAGAAGADPARLELVWAPEASLRDVLDDVEEEARPLWFPEDQIPQAAIDASRAAAAGLRFRPAEETARDALAWIEANPREDGLRAGWPAEAERALLERLRPA